MKQRNRGFTMMELMITLAVAGIILGLAVPNLQEFRRNNRMSNTANDMLAAIVKARGEAMRRQRTVVVCPSSNPNAAEPTCGVWAAAVGWIIFVDGDPTVPTAANCAREAGIEQVLGAFTYDQDRPTDRIRVNTTGTCIAFSPTGYRQTIAATIPLIRMLMCDSRGVVVVAGTNNLSAARGIQIQPTGRAAIHREMTGGLSGDLTSWGLTCP
jgi:prepilin-type N-terminal cleavage/methylation domain-containing protein